MTNLVLVHGRSQQNKDSVALKEEWLASLRAGLAKTRLEMPIPDERVRFPYYGDTLWQMVQGRPDGEVAEVIVRGRGADEGERELLEEVVQAVQEKTGISDEQVDEVLDSEVRERGPLNWEVTQGILRAVDRFVPFGSGASIALATRDVYRYLTNLSIRDRIETGILQAMEPGVPTVVVSHSLGTVVAYNLLRREGATRGWKVPVFVTLGSPLGIRGIKKRLSPIGHPECAGAWKNAMDERDVVALYPLTDRNFSVDPDIENKTDVDNHTRNRHGIAGYLEDPDVATWIHAALTAG